MMWGRVAGAGGGGAVRQGLVICGKANSSAAELNLD